MRGARDSDLPLLHGLEHCGLHLGWRTIDLVAEHNVGENWSWFEAKLPGPILLVIDFSASDV